MNEIRQIFQKQGRYFLAIIFMAIIFLISKNFFIDYTTTSSECEGGKCQKEGENPEISGKSAIYFINDILHSEPGQYYRLVFGTRSSQDTRIVVELSNARDERMTVKTLELSGSDSLSFEEIMFLVSGKYTDLVFRKEKTNDESKIFIKNINLEKLNIHDEKDYLNLKPTLFGEVNVDLSFAEQTGASRNFLQLKTENTLLGQIFQAESDYISGVAFDIDVTKIDNRGGKKYILDLREAEFDGETYSVGKNSLASLGFTVSNLEKYRQKDGRIRFPVFAFLQKGKYYFIGIDNEKVKPDEFNFLAVKGSSDDKYQSGTAVVKKSGDTLKVNGDLYFTVYGAQFSEFDGERILGGAIYEDLGRNRGIFIYKTEGSPVDFIDLDFASSDVKFDSEKNAIAGLRREAGTNFIYEFNTIYPFISFNFKAEQADISWGKVGVQYSFDQENWKEIPYIEENEIQRFSYTVENNISQNKIYIKATPLQEENPEITYYGIKNLEIRVDLIIK